MTPMVRRRTMPGGSISLSRKNTPNICLRAPVSAKVVTPAWMYGGITTAATAAQALRLYAPCLAYHVVKSALAARLLIVPPCALAGAVSRRRLPPRAALPLPDEPREVGIWMNLLAAAALLPICRNVGPLSICSFLSVNSASRAGTSTVVANPWGRTRPAEALFARFACPAPGAGNPVSTCSTFAGQCRP